MYPASGEVNLTLEDTAQTIELVCATYEQTATSIDTTDGISMEFDEWRFNLRSSNTEPVVRLKVEAKGDAKLMRQNTKELLNLLRSVR